MLRVMEARFLIIREGGFKYGKGENKNKLKC